MAKINTEVAQPLIFFIIGGKLADIHGTKRIFLIGTLLFTLGSLIAGLSINFPMLIIGRLIQGTGFAFTLGLAFIMVTNAFPDEQRGFVVGLTVTMTGLGRALGPTLGGAILEELHWHWIFLINVPLAIISLLIISLFATAKKIEQAKQKMDYLGMILLGCAITVLLLAFNNLTHHHVNLKLFLISLVASLLIFLCFYWRESKATSPLVNFQLFKQGNYLLIFIIRIFYQYIYGVFLFFMPLFLQNLAGYSPLVAGLMILVFSAFIAICSPMTGICCDQLGYKPVIIFSSVMGLLGFMLLTQLSDTTPIYIILLGFSLCGICAGTMISSTNNAAVASIPPANKGEGMGIFFTGAFIGLSLGVAASGAQMNFVSMHHITHIQSHLISNLPHSTLNTLQRVVNGTMPASKLKTFISPDHYAAI